MEILLITFIFALGGLVYNKSLSKLKPVKVKSKNLDRRMIEEYYRNLK